MTTTNRAIRIDDETWSGAKAAAESAGTTVSEVVRDALRKFATDPPAKVPAPPP